MLKVQEPSLVVERRYRIRPQALMPVGAPRPSSDMSDGGSSSAQSKRRHFPETWLWDLTHRYKIHYNLVTILLFRSSFILLIHLFTLLQLHFPHAHFLIHQLVDIAEYTPDFQLTDLAR